MSQTPLMRQYKQVKEEHIDSILFFRLGDFYEMFYEDAKLASKILGITLTARNKEKGENIPMAGVPHHSASSYIAKLIEAGHKVAICEQTEDASASKGLVKRGVTQIITPGTFSDINFLDSKSNNYIVGFCCGDHGAALAYIDLTTGEFSTTEIQGDNFKKSILNELYNIDAKEIVLGIVKDVEMEKAVDKYGSLKGIPISKGDIGKDSASFLQNYFNLLSLTPFGLDGRKYSIAASAMLLKYVLKLQNCDSITKINYIPFAQYMHLDYSSQMNLDLFSSKKEQECSLFSILDKTKSSMGARLLKRMIGRPLLDKEAIEKRHRDIGYLIANPLIRGKISESLSNVYDLERLLGKVLRRDCNARDLNSLKKSLNSYVDILEIDNSFFTVKKEEVVKIYNLIDRTLIETNQISIRDGGIIRPEQNEELAELHDISEKGQEYILELEQKEKERSGIKGLKIRYNKIFGYFIEVTKLNVHLVPENFIRRQTLSNAERYITIELKDYEEKILGAKEKISELEYNIFIKLVDSVIEVSSFIEKVAKELSYLDVILSLSEVALRNSYVCPEMFADKRLDIGEGRHPIVEVVIGDFIPNGAKMGSGEIIILTGPNMSGKSTYMKQTALIILMAQMGSYVPASYAKIGIVDKIFTRIGAADNLASGESTFMVEMNEVSNILNNSTSNSFIVLDEVGRGTSTFDGIAIATAMTEYIHNKIGAKTIFATHYHELNSLDSLERVKNFRFEVSEEEDRVLFLKKIVEGGADKSYGIEVARLAALPKEVLIRSNNLLRDMGIETIDKSPPTQSIDSDPLEEKVEIAPKESKLISHLKSLNLNSLSPLEAFSQLIEIKEKYLKD